MIYEFLVFGLKQARACIFAGSFLLLIIISPYIHIPGLDRADLLFIGAVLIQLIMLATKLETVDEAKVIVLFHLIGLGLELYKTHPAIGSWSYPDLGHFHIMNVPLYSGFMYASIGSYLAQSWNIFDLKLHHVPSYTYIMTLCLLIYANFFTNHYLYDVRWFLATGVLVLFWKTRVSFVVVKERRTMPLVLSFVLIAFFVWIAENIGTFFSAWRYPYQVTTWSAVSLGKISSWSLLVILSFIVVAYLKHVKEERQKTATIP